MPRRRRMAPRRSLRSFGAVLVNPGRRRRRRNRCGQELGQVGATAGPRGLIEG